MTGWPLFALGALVAGTAIGGFAGHATVVGMRPDMVVTERAAGAYGIPIARADFGSVEPASSPADDGAIAVSSARYDGDCADCSDWELGYRWGRSRDLHGDGACNVDSWSFQQGCEAAARARDGA